MNPPGAGAAPKPPGAGALPNPPVEAGAPKPPEAEDAGAPKPPEVVETGAPNPVELEEDGAPKPVEDVAPKPVEVVEEPKPPGAGALVGPPKLVAGVGAPPNWNTPVEAGVVDAVGCVELAPKLKTPLCVGAAGAGEPNVENEADLDAAAWAKDGGGAA